MTSGGCLPALFASLSRASNADFWNVPQMSRNDAVDLSFFLDLSVATTSDDEFQQGNETFANHKEKKSITLFSPKEANS